MKYNIYEFKRLSNIYASDMSAENLDMIKKYLDDCGIKMSKPLYRYKEDDITTWKYLDGSFRKISAKKYDYFYVEKLNPKFAYKNVK